MRKILLLLVILLLVSCSTNNIVFNGKSMFPTIDDQQNVKYVEGNDNINKGDLVIFKYGDSRMNIKRIIGLPGETLKIENGKVYIKEVGNNDFIEIQENYLDDNNKLKTFVIGESKLYEYKIPLDSYFLMGDNRNQSTDSRDCFSSCLVPGNSNFLNKKYIVGIVKL